MMLKECRIQPKQFENLMGLINGSYVKSGKSVKKEMKTEPPKTTPVKQEKDNKQKQTMAERQKQGKTRKLKSKQSQFMNEPHSDE